MDSWVDILLPGAAVLALFGVVGLVIQVIRLGRALRRFEERSALGGGSATDVSLRRLQELQARISGRTTADPVGPGGGRGRRVAAVVGVLAIAAVAGGGGWYFLLRDDGTAADTALPPPPPVSTTTATGTSTSPGAPPLPAGSVPPNPKPLVTKASYTVAVLNASGVSGAAGDIVGPKVTLAGYILGPVGNTQLQDPSTSVVMWPRGKRNVAWNVANDLEITRATPLDGISSDGLEDVDAVVVVGLDLAQG